MYVSARGGGSERQKVIEFLNWTRRSCQFCMTVFCLLVSIVLPNVMTSCVREDTRDGNISFRIICATLWPFEEEDMLLIGQERGWVGTKSVGWGTGRLVTACHPPLCLTGRPTQYVIDSLTSTRPHLPTTMSIVLPFVSTDTPLIHVLLNLRHIKSKGEWT